MPTRSRKHRVTGPRRRWSAAREATLAPAELDFSRHDALAQQLGAEFILDVTTGNQDAASWRDEVTQEELGGPFIITKASTELADDVDGSNPIDAEPAAYPTANAGRP